MTKLLFLALLFAFPLSICSQGEPKETVTIACDALPAKKKPCEEGVALFKIENPDIDVRVIEAPTGSNNRLAWLLQLLSAKDSSVDVYLIDTPWAGLLQNHLEPLNPLLSKEELSLFHPLLLQNNTVGGTLLALPWYVDVGLLIYRKDLLDKYKQPVPVTWDQLEKTARFIQTEERAAGNPKMWGYVFSGKAFEGLTCNVIEWLQSHNQEIISKDGKVQTSNPEIAALFKRFASWIGDIVPPGAMNYAEEDSRGVFQSGNAVFIRHWPYIIPLAEAGESPLKGKIGVVPLPKGGDNGRHAATLGGWNLAISKYSKHKAAALKLLKYLTSPKELARRALVAGYYPPLPSLYDQQTIQTGLPHSALIKELLDHVALRPSAQTGLKYNQVSAALWNVAHKILLKKQDAEKAMIALEKQLNALSKNGQSWHIQ